MQPPEATPLGEHLSAGAAALGVTLGAEQHAALLAYLALIGKWNKVYNLTSVRDPADMLATHLLDSLAVVPPLRRHLGERPAAVLDVGSGAGLPGVVLAIIDSGWRVTCVDTVGKKASFIQQVAVELRLPNLFARHDRVEALQAEPFDVVTSRAFASLPDFVQLSARHVGASGVWVAMKGKAPQDELAQLPTDIDVFHVEPLSVPGLAAERCLVWMRPSR